MNDEIDDVRIPPAEVWFFPYLTGLGDRERVGDWELIPVARLTPDDCRAGHDPSAAYGVGRQSSRGLRVGGRGWLAGVLKPDGGPRQ